MKTIPLTQGKAAIVDDQDFEWLSQWKWMAKHIRFDDHSVWYASRTIGHRGPTVFIHREVSILMGYPDSPEVDHKDHDGLNNQRSNLRPCTSSQNKWNQLKRIGLSSRFKGVTWHRRDERWMASLMCNGRDYYLGLFVDEVEAGKAYDVAARSHFGEFAKLNFP